MKKTYADLCLDRAEKATEGNWSYGIFGDIPELCRRLNRAVEILKGLQKDWIDEIIINEIESVPRGDKND